MTLARLAPRRWSIKTKSIVLFAAYVVALCGVYLTFTLLLLRREATAANDRLLQTARMLAAEIDAHISSGRQKLATVAELPGLVYGLRRIREAGSGGHIPPWTTLHYLFFRSPVFTGGVSLLDDTGKVLWTEPPGLNLLGEQLGDTPGIRELRADDRHLISTGLAAGRLLAAPHVVVGSPIRDPSGDTAGILGGVIDLTAPQFTALLGAVSTQQGRFAALLDQSGHLLAATGATPLLRPLTLPYEDGEEPLVARVSLSEAPWQVVAGQPRGTALAEIWQLQRLLLLLGAGLVGVMVAVGAPFVGGLVRSVETLTAHADTMARGDLSSPVAVGRRHDEIATLARTFERMRVELERSQVALTSRLREREELIRLKEEFLANMSHELRTPLNVIIGYADMLLEESPTSEAVDPLRRIRSQAEHLFQLLLDVMTLSGLNTGKIALEISPVTVGDVLGRITPLVDRLRQGKDIDVQWDCPASLLTIETDPLRLEQVLTNLITNAFKFTPSGVITICVREEPESQRIVFQVADTGIGIAEQEIPHIFDEFRQADGSMSRDYSGMGLGLALVKRLTELLHGNVGVQSAVNRGSIFTVAIPPRWEMC